MVFITVMNTKSPKLAKVIDATGYSDIEVDRTIKAYNKYPFIVDVATVDTTRYSTAYMDRVLAERDRRVYQIKSN